MLIPAAEWALVVTTGEEEGEEEEALAKHPING